MAKSFDRDWEQLLRTSLEQAGCLFPKGQSPSSLEFLSVSHAGVLTYPEGRLDWSAWSKKQSVGGWEGYCIQGVVGKVPSLRVVRRVGVTDRLAGCEDVGNLIV